MRLFRAAFVLFFCLLFPLVEAETVRIGCYAGDALYKSHGVENTSSYLSEFLNTINRYTDWQFEYVYIDSDHAQEALESGLVDVLPFAGKGMAKEADLLLSDVPTAVGSLCLAGLTKPADMQNLRIAVSENVPEDLYFQVRTYMEQQGLGYRFIRFPSLQDLKDALEQGKADVVAMIDFGLPEGMEIVASVAPQFFYLATTADNEPLFLRLNQALSLAFNLSPELLDELRQRYVPASDEGIFDLTYRERQYVASRPLIRIAVTESQPPYSYLEKGKIRGILVEQVKTVFAKSGLDYVFVPAKSYREAVALVVSDKADVIYAMADTLNETDAGFFKLTKSLFRQRSLLVTHPGEVTKEDCIFVGVRAYQYMDVFVSSKLDPAQQVWCETAEDCLLVVKNLKNSFTVIPSLELNAFEQSHLFPGVERQDEGYLNSLSMGISRRAAPELCSILDKSIYKLSSSLMEDYLAENLAVGGGLQAAIKQHPFLFLGLLIVILFLLTVAVFFIIYNTTKRRKDRQIANAMNLANRDAMTGLYNHVAYEKLVNSTLLHQEPGRLNAMVMVDIDNFKHINDSLGHGTGDLVIVTLANILFSTFRQGDFKCRMGGDEFSVFMKDVADQAGVESKLTFFMQELKQAFEGLGLTVPVTCSVGVVLCRGPYDGGFESLYAAADKALYTVKEGGKNSFAIAEEVLTGLGSPVPEHRGH